MAGGLASLAAVLGTGRRRLVRAPGARSTWRAWSTEPAWVGLGGLLAVALVLAVGLWFVSDAPVGDLALIEAETRRVFSSSPPLLGAYSRYGWRHPGPALFAVLAVPYTLLGRGAAALATAAVLVNVVAIVGTVVLARRRGAAAGAVMAAVLLLLLNGMGTDGIGDAWNVSITLVPLVLVVVAAWSALCGDRWGLPALLLGFVFVAESHVGNGVAAAPVAVVTVAVLLLSRRRRERLREGGRALPVTAAIAGLAVVPVVVDVLRDPPGNLGRLAEWSLTNDETTLGWGEVFRLLGRTSSLSFLWHPEQPRFVIEATTDSAGVLPGALVALLVVVMAAAWRARRPEEATLCGLVLVWWLAAVVAVRSIVAPPWYWLVEWLQPLGWVTVGAVALTAWRVWGRGAWRWARPAASIGLLGLGAVTLVGQAGVLDELREREGRTGVPVTGLADASASVASAGGVSFELGGSLFAGEEMLAGVVNELGERGVRVCVTADLAYKFPAATACAPEGTTHLVLRTEQAVEEPPPGTRLLTVVDDLDPPTRSRVARTRDAVVAALRTDGRSELSSVVDTPVVADVLLDQPTPAIADLDAEIRWLDRINSGPHARYALYQRLDG